MRPTPGKNPSSNTLLSRLHRYGVHNGGATAVVAAMLFPVVIGGMGLGAETGYHYLSQRKLQHAVDASVHAAGARKRAGDTTAEIKAAALHVAIQSGFRPASAALTVNPNYTSAAHPGAMLVEVTATETQPRLFSSVFNNEPVTFGARAVAKVIPDPNGSVACVLALSPTRSGAVTVSGSTSIDLLGCDVASNSNALDSFLMSGTSSALSAGCVYAVGEAVTNTGLTLTRCASVEQYAPLVRDPYASVAEPVPFGTCRNKNQGSPSSTKTLTPTEDHPSGVKSIRFCSGLDVKGTVIFDPGLYIIEGGTFTINSGNIDSSGLVSLTGSGVTFLFTGGASLKLGNNGVLDFSAPTTGPFSGILFFGSRNETGISHNINGGSGSTTQGAVYVPASPINFRGSSKTTNGCTQIIARQVVFTGSSSLRSSCDNAGTRGILTNEVVTIVE